MREAQLTGKAKKIALEEHFLCPDTEPYFADMLAGVPDPKKAEFLRRLHDFGDERLAAMDSAGIEISVLSVSGPGVQGEKDVAKAVRIARTSNEFLAKKVASNTKRYRGFAHIALQDGKEAANELARCVKDYGFCGALINGGPLGLYLDDASINPFWEKAEELGVPVYLHPADAHVPFATLAGYPVLARPTWGWGIETGSHALRILFGGEFERFPKSKLILGHLGETLPYLLWRIDSRALTFQAVKMSKAPSQFIRDNIVVTNSGMYSREPLRCAIDALGIGNVMFSADYPFEDIVFAGQHADGVEISAQERQAICWDNAWRHLNLGGK
jgi:2,3-dihydroxybenzoate decarboxylase